MKNFYKVKNYDVTKLCHDLRSLFYDLVNNEEMFGKNTGNSISFRAWNYMEENYNQLFSLKNKIPLGDSISFLKGRDFFTDKNVRPHSHDNKYGWSLLWGLENCNKNMTTQFFIEKDNRIPESTPYSLKDSDHNGEKAFQRNLLTKSLDELQFIEKFAVLNNEIYMFNGNTYHFPIYEGSNYNIHKDRMVAHWYVKNDDLEFLTNTLSL